MLDLQVQGWVYSWDLRRWAAVILLDRPQDLQAQALAWDSAQCQESCPVPADHLSCSAVLVLSPFLFILCVIYRRLKRLSLYKKIVAFLQHCAIISNLLGDTSCQQPLPQPQR